jgi:glutamyl endopeptidase
MRRQVKAAVAIVAAAVAMAGVTISPPGGAPDPQEVLPSVRVISSTRGDITLPVVPRPGFGQPRRQPVGTESVIGTDGRTWLRETTRYPNSAIGRLDFRSGGRSYWCTGALIDPDTVLTAGHCVHDGSGSTTGWSTAMRFTPAVNRGVEPFGECDGIELLTVPGWYATGAETEDLGLVQLDCEVGHETGWLGVKAVPGAGALRNLPVHVRGYPGDMAWGSLWTMRDRIRVSGARMVFYLNDTYGGESGAPVFSWRDCNGEYGACIVAVHAYGVHGRHSPHARYNHGARITANRLSVISQVAADNA